MKADNLNNYVENEWNPNVKAHTMHTRAKQKHFTEEKVEWSQRIFNTAFPFGAELNVLTSLPNVHPNVFITNRNGTP